MPGAALLRAERSSERLHLPSLQPVFTGMPELCRAGLSENWLLKACGHRHWLALAEAHGLAVPEFRDSGGTRLYPAFTRLRIDEARLETVGENVLVDFAVTLRRTSATRFRSSIAVTGNGSPVAAVTMETAFIRRTVAGSNRAVSRAVVARPCMLLPQPREHQTRREEDPGQPVASLILDPAPHEDFNGVGFLYFAAFQALADRAEWHWFRAAAATREREIVFLANAELGDRIRADLRSGTGAHHRIDLYRESDGAPIARIATRRDSLG